MSDRDRIAALLVPELAAVVPVIVKLEDRRELVRDWAYRVADSLISAGVTMPDRDQCGGRVQLKGKTVRCVWTEGHAGLCR